MLEQGSACFKKKDWKRIGPSINTSLALTDLKTCADSFYIKDVAVWVPHLLLPNHIPCCPHCGRSDCVDLSKAEFVARPKILHGIRSHRYLDTMMYKCVKCSKSFTGYNPQSLEKDATKVLGVFTFFVCRGFALDEECYSCITNHSHDTTASIHRRVALAHTDQFLDDSLFYYRCCCADKITKESPRGTVPGDRRQRTIDYILTCHKDTPEEKKRKTLMTTLKAKQWELRSKKSAFENDIKFIRVFEQKKNRNAINLPFKGIGKAKLLLMIGEGIATARQLLDYDFDDPDRNPKIKEQWKNIVENYYENLEFEMDVLQSEVTTMEREIDLHDLLEGAGMDSEDEEAPATPAPTAKQEPFSHMLDPTKCNSRCMSKGCVDRVVATDHKRRRKLQDAKMRNVPAQTLKIDFHYKLPDKVKVCSSKGKSFSPFKCGVTTQNEDCLTLFWKFLTAAESIEAIKPDLLRLKQRLEHLNPDKPLSVIYVDNCCTVRDKLVAIFPGALVKLDTFHWFMRWDDILLNKTSEEANFFRYLMRRALFVIEESEKMRVRYLKPGIIDKYVYKFAKATIPMADIVTKRVEACLNHIFLLDHEADCQSVGDNNQEGASVSGATARKRYLKPFDFKVKKGARYIPVRQLIHNQLEHVRKGCLSDPPAQIVKVHRINARTGEAKSARGTGGNENQHRELNAALDAPSVGIARAERIIDDCCEMSNDRKMVKRLGMKEQPTYRTDKLLFLNSLAQSCGFQQAQLPFDVSYPPSPPIEEFMGMSFELPDEFLPSKSPDEEEENVDDGVNDMQQFLDGIDFENDDIPINANQFTPRDETTAAEEIDTRLHEDGFNAEDLEPIEFETFEREVARALPAIIDKETTMEAWE